MKEKFVCLILIISLSSCGGNKSKTPNSNATNLSDLSAYKGTASITQGLATTTMENIFTC